MKIHVVCLIVFALSTSVLAQAPARSSGNPISQAIRDGWNGAKRNFSGAASAMPEAKYGFKPVDSVRTFGQIVAHVAGANYIFCAAARAEKSPHTEDAFEKSATTRAAIIKELDDSIKYCDAAYAADDGKLAEMIDAPFGGGKSPRAAALMGNTGHVQEHYGNLVTYLRINGLVPPSSQP
jgi:hypothetical protein